MNKLPDRPFLLAELAEVGLTRATLRHGLADGSVRRVLYGVYVRGDLPDTLQLRAKSAALVLGPSAVICDRSAAWLWGISCLDWPEQEFLPDLEVVAIDGADRSRRRGVLGGKRDLRDDEICEIEGVRVTTPLRTACDLACLRGRSGALAVLDAFCRQFGLTPADYERMLSQRFRGRRGAKQARELAPYAVADAESQGESWSRMAIVDAGLRPPTPQVWVLLPGLGWVRLDMAYEHLKVAVEYDGEEFHTSDEHRRADERRRAALREAGWVVIVVRKADLKPEAVDRWTRELRAVIDERVPAYRRRYSRGESWDPRRH